MDHTPSRDGQDGRLTLPDGRILSYCQYGTPDASPVFYFHGWPGSRREPGYFDLSAIRLIAVDRPGYGGSSPAPGRTLGDWPADIAALADALDLERFGLVGLSGGGPYGAACAQALGERVAVCVLISALGPPEAPGMKDMPVRLLRMIGRSPGTSGVLLGLARRLILQQGNERLIMRLRKLRPHADRDMEALDPEFLTYLIASSREGVGQSTEGMASDARIYGETWPFSVSDIGCPLRIWHGKEDRVVPFSIAEHYAAHGSDAALHLREHEGHFSLVKHGLDEIIADLLACWHDNAAGATP